MKCFSYGCSSNNDSIVYELIEDDLWDFMQAFCRYILKFEDENLGYHPPEEQRDKWMIKYARTHLNRKPFCSKCKEMFDEDVNKSIDELADRCPYA